MVGNLLWVRGVGEWDGLLVSSGPLEGKGPVRALALEGCYNTGHVARMCWRGYGYEALDELSALVAKATVAVLNYCKSFSMRDASSLGVNGFEM